MFENEARMEGIQGRFPYDDLHLHDSCVHAAPKMKTLHRRRSAPGVMLLKSFGKRSSSASTHLPELAPSKSPPQALHEHRTFLLEGSVLLTMGLQTQERYFFLFSDILLIAKQKSSTTFRLKSRIRVCEIWLSTSCFDVVSETTTSADRSFVIGWPTTNVVATFDTTELRDVWFSKIKEQINDGKESEHPKSTILRVLNKDFEGPVSKCITVSNVEDTDNVVKRCLDEFHIKTGDVQDYQLWVVAGKEETPYPLIGHEHPYSIKMSHVRDALGNTDDMVQAMDVDEEAGSQLQFILRPTKKAPIKVSLEDAVTKRKKFKKSPLINLFRKSRGSAHDSSQESTSPPMLTPTGKLFRHTLTELCEEDVLPKPILGLMYQLFLHGPFTTGIFRKGANQRQCRELQEKLDVGQTVVLEETQILVIGATFKVFIRSLPDCVFQCELYEEWCDAVENVDGNTVDRVKKIMEKLPKCHIMLIRYILCVLHHISQRSDENQMTSLNLGICIGPSLLWPSVAADMAAHADAAKRVPKFVEFLIDNCREVLGEGIVHLFGEPAQQKSRPDSSTDSDSMHSMLSLQEQPGGLRRIGSSLDSLDHSEMETSGLIKTHLFQTNLSRDSGLTSSDTQLYSEHMEPHAIPAADIQVRKKSLTRSTSQFDEVKPKQEPPTVLSSSYDSSLNAPRESSDIPPPVPPPRKTRRKAPEPPSDKRPYQQVENSANVQLIVESNEEANVPTSNNAKPNLIITKQRSSESIGSSSLEEYPGSLESGANPDSLQVNPAGIDILQCNDIGELRKSASGAKIYLNEQLISNAVSSVDHGQSKSSPVTTYSSSLPSKKPDHKNSKRTPPPMKEPPSYEESVLRARGKAAEVRARSANRHSWNISPENVRGSQTSASNTPQSVTTEGCTKQVHVDTYSSVDNLHAASEQFVADRYSSMQELRRHPPAKQNEGAYEQSPLRRGSEGTPQQKMCTPTEPKQTVRDPVLKTLMVEGAENKEEVLRKVRVGMTPKGGDIFPKHMRSIIRHSLHDDEIISRGRTARKAAGHDANVKPQRSESFAARQNPPPQMDRIVVPRSVEKSASDTSVVDQFENNAKRHGWKRPSKPPTYQEAIQRKSLLKSALPLYQVSQHDVTQQREKSSKAAQLYQESMKRYELQADDPNSDRANEGHIDAEVEEDPAPRVNNDVLFKREPPPTRQIDHPKRSILEVEPHRQAVDSRREVAPSSDQHKSYRQQQHGSSGAEHQRLSNSPQRSEQVRSSRVHREQRRNSDPRSRSANNRNRRDHSSPNLSRNESDRNIQVYRDDKRENFNRQQAPPNQQSNKKESNRNRKSKPRDQRLSDTRLDNNKANELNKQYRSGLVRSKSDSSEHLNKIGRFKELQALDSNIIEHYRKLKLNAENEALKDSEAYSGRHRRRSVNSVRNRDWHKDLAEQYSDMFYMPTQETNNNKVIYSYNTKQPDNNGNQPEEKPKKRGWQPPVHPTKDLVVNNNNQSQERPATGKRDKGRRSMPANFSGWSTAEGIRQEVVNKENKLIPVAMQDRQDESSEETWTKNIKERIAEYPSRVASNNNSVKQQQQQQQLHRVAVHQPTHSVSQSHAPKQSQNVQSQAKFHQHKNQGTQPHPQRGSQKQGHVHVSPQKDSSPSQDHEPHSSHDEESEAGLTWSVAKLRNRFSQGNSNIFYDPTSQESRDSRHGGRKSVREPTNAYATEEYI